jgi:hypothetical protein
MNLLACLGSNAVKNISFEFNIAMFLFIINIQSLNFYAGKLAPVGVTMKSK